MMISNKPSKNVGFFRNGGRYPLFWYESCNIVRVGAMRKEDE